MANIEDTLTDRGKTHGDWAIQSAFSQRFKELLFANDPGYSASQREALEMICVKLSRIANGDPNEIDHWRDLSGYSMLVVKELEK